MLIIQQMLIILPLAVFNNNLLIQWGSIRIENTGDYTIYYPITYNNTTSEVYGSTGWWEVTLNPYQFYTTRFITNLNNKHGNTGWASYYWMSIGF